MSIDDDLYLLQSVASLAPLGNSALRVLAIGAEMRNIAHDKALFVAGEAADAAFVVQSGTFIVRPEGSEDFVAGPGTLFGLNALLVENTSAGDGHRAAGFRRDADLAQPVSESA